MIHTQDSDVSIYQGDALDVLRDFDYPNQIQAVVTSPPYMDARPEYGHPDGEWWFDFFTWSSENVGDGPVLLNVGRLWRDGEESDWWMRLLKIAKSRGLKHLDTLVWAKPNANPIHGRVFSNNHEYVLVLGWEHTRLNTDDLRTPYTEESLGRMNRRWVNGRGVKGDTKDDQDGREMNPLGARPKSYIEIGVGREKGNEHPAPMPLALAEYMVRLAGRGPILDPFFGSGTTGIACRNLGQTCVGIEISAEYCDLAAKRLSQLSLLT